MKTKLQDKLSGKVYEVSQKGINEVIRDANNIIDDIINSIGSCEKCRYSYYTRLSDREILTCSIDGSCVNRDYYCGDFKDRSND